MDMFGFTFPHMDATSVALVVGFLGKTFIVAADSMPPPPENCGFWTRWAYDFVQRYASNSAKVGESRHQAKQPSSPVPPV